MLPEQEQRHVYYDSDLQIEAYNLTGIVQKFPNHFHKYYVIGFVEGGKRHLWCMNEEYDTSAGDLILFNPMDCHYCAPVNGEILDYRAVNIDEAVMKKAVRELTGKEYLPKFTSHVVYQSDITAALDSLYCGIVEHAPKLSKEEAFYFLLEQVLREHCEPTDREQEAEKEDKVSLVCQYLEDHFSENIALDDLADLAQISKSHLLLLFTKHVGVSPYRYLQSYRIEKTKRLLEQGILPADAAFIAGFTDQSHFTRFFKEFIGLTPKQYQKIFKEKAEPETGFAAEVDRNGI